MANEVSMWPGLMPSVISAASGFAGVLVGGLLTHWRESSREERQKTQTVNYLAILVVAHLDQLADTCLDVSYDDGTEYGQPAGGDDRHQITVTAPRFDPLALPVDWKALPTALMYEVLHLPQVVAQIEKHVSNAGEFDSGPDYPEFFFERQLQYGRLGVRAAGIASRLRQHAGLPPFRAEIGSWDRDASLTSRVAALEERLTRIHTPNSFPISPS